MITKLDFVGVPSTDADRSRSSTSRRSACAPTSKSDYEFWVGETCFGIWEPAKMGMEFAPQKNAHPALHVDDVAAARAELEAKGVEFNGDTFDTGVCHMALFTRPRRQRPDAAPPLRAIERRRAGRHRALGAARRPPRGSPSGA